MCTVQKEKLLKTEFNIGLRKIVRFGGEQRDSYVVYLPPKICRQLIKNGIKYVEVTIKPVEI